MFEYKLITAGERLAYYVEKHFVDVVDWNTFGTMMRWTGRHLEFIEFFQEIAVVHFACRVISKSKHLLNNYVQPGQSWDTAINDIVFQEHVRNFLVNQSIDLDDILFANMYKIIAECLLASKSKFPKNSLKQKHRANDCGCYMCGQQLDYSTRDENQHDRYRLDHIWPLSFGGNSVEENALPACHSCNGTKTNYPTWCFPHIQFFIHGDYPSNADGRIKFAAHYRKARLYAIENNTTLKGAFLQIGPWISNDFSLKDIEDTCDFFNLHVPTVND